MAPVPASTGATAMPRTEDCSKRGRRFSAGTAQGTARSDARVSVSARAEQAKREASGSLAAIANGTSTRGHLHRQGRAPLLSSDHPATLGRASCRFELCRELPEVRRRSRFKGTIFSARSVGIVVVDDQISGLGRKGGDDNCWSRMESDPSTVTKQRNVESRRRAACWSASASTR